MSYFKNLYFIPLFGVVFLGPKDLSRQLTPTPSSLCSASDTCSGCVDISFQPQASDVSGVCPAPQVCIDTKNNKPGQCKSSFEVGSSDSCYPISLESKNNITTADGKVFYSMNPEIKQIFKNDPTLKQMEHPLFMIVGPEFSNMTNDTYTLNKACLPSILPVNGSMYNGTASSTIGDSNSCVSGNFSFSSHFNHSIIEPIFIQDSRLYNPQQRFFTKNNDLRNILINDTSAINNMKLLNYNIPSNNTEQFLMTHGMYVNNDLSPISNNLIQYNDTGSELLSLLGGEYNVYNSQEGVVNKFGIPVYCIMQNEDIVTLSKSPSQYIFKKHEKGDFFKYSNATHLIYGDDFYRFNYTNSTNNNFMETNANQFNSSVYYRVQDTINYTPIAFPTNTHPTDICDLSNSPITFSDSSLYNEINYPSRKAKLYTLAGRYQNAVGNINLGVPTSAFEDISDPLSAPRTKLRHVLSRQILLKESEPIISILYPSTNVQILTQYFSPSAQSSLLNVDSTNLNSNIYRVIDTNNNYLSTDNFDWNQFLYPMNNIFVQNNVLKDVAGKKSLVTTVLYKDPANNTLYSEYQVFSGSLMYSNGSQTISTRGIPKICFNGSQTNWNSILHSVVQYSVSSGNTGSTNIIFVKKAGSLLKYYAPDVVDSLGQFSAMGTDGISVTQQSSDFLFGQPVYVATSDGVQLINNFNPNNYVFPNSCKAPGTLSSISDIFSTFIVFQDINNNNIMKGWSIIPGIYLSDVFSCAYINSAANNINSTPYSNLFTSTIVCDNTFTNNKYISNDLTNSNNEMILPPILISSDIIESTDENIQSVLFSSLPDILDCTDSNVIKPMSIYDANLNCNNIKSPHIIKRIFNENEIAPAIFLSDNSINSSERQIVSSQFFSIPDQINAYKKFNNLQQIKQQIKILDLNNNPSDYYYIGNRYNMTQSHRIYSYNSSNLTNSLYNSTDNRGLYYYGGLIGKEENGSLVFKLGLSDSFFDIYSNNTLKMKDKPLYFIPDSSLYFDGNISAISGLNQTMHSIPANDTTINIKRYILSSDGINPYNQFNITGNLSLLTHNISKFSNLYNSSVVLYNYDENPGNIFTNDTGNSIVLYPGYGDPIQGFLLGKLGDIVYLSSNNTILPDLFNASIYYLSNNTNMSNLINLDTDKFNDFYVKKNKALCGTNSQGEILTCRGNYYDSNHSILPNTEEGLRNASHCLSFADQSGCTNNPLNLEKCFTNKYCPATAPLCCSGSNNIDSIECIASKEYANGTQINIFSRKSKISCNLDNKKAAAILKYNGNSYGNSKKYPSPMGTISTCEPRTYIGPSNSTINTIARSNQFKINNTDYDDACVPTDYLAVTNKKINGLKTDICQENETCTGVVLTAKGNILSNKIDLEQNIQDKDNFAIACLKPNKYLCYPTHDITKEDIQECGIGNSCIRDNKNNCVSKDPFSSKKCTETIPEMIITHPILYMATQNCPEGTSRKFSDVSISSSDPFLNFTSNNVQSSYADLGRRLHEYTNYVYSHRDLNDISYDVLSDPISTSFMMNFAQPLIISIGYIHTNQNISIAATAINGLFLLIAILGFTFHLKNFL